MNPSDILTKERMISALENLRIPVKTQFFIQEIIAEIKGGEE
jgi:hypothetical protein